MIRKLNEDAVEHGVGATKRAPSKQSAATSKDLRELEGGGLGAGTREGNLSTSF